MLPYADSRTLHTCLTGLLFAVAVAVADDVISVTVGGARVDFLGVAILTFGTGVPVGMEVEMGSESIFVGWVVDFVGVGVFIFGAGVSVGVEVVVGVGVGSEVQFVGWVVVVFAGLLLVCWASLLGGCGGSGWPLMQHRMYVMPWMCVFE